MESWCASMSGWCFQSYHKREPLLLEMYWAAADLLNNMNHGMTFCPRLASWIFLLAIFNLCFPFFLRNFSRRTVWEAIKVLSLLLMPFFGFQLFWRPYNFFLHFLVTSFIDSSCSDWLPTMSLCSALAILFLSCWASGAFRSLFIRHTAVVNALGPRESKSRSQKLRTFQSRSSSPPRQSSRAETFKQPLPAPVPVIKVSMARKKQTGLKVPAQPMKPPTSRKRVESRKPAEGMNPLGMLGYFFNGKRGKPEYKYTRSGCIYGRWA